MCNIAGYTGSRRAAPILVEMMRRQEGFNSGYYTGIATIDNGRLYSAKVVGDLDQLLRTTDALDLPGTVGIIHGRTPSGGGREWAYPFVSQDRQFACVGNGHIGVFQGSTDFSGEAARLEQLGYTFLSKTHDPIAPYPVMPDGCFVHYNEVHCRLIEEQMHAGRSPFDALLHTLRNYPAEDVLVSIHAACPASLLVARYAMPMMCARADGECFIATTAAALPAQHFFGIELLPANAGAEITPEGLRIVPCLNPGVQVGELTLRRVLDATHQISEALRQAENPLTFSDLASIAMALFEPGELPQAGMLIYIVLDLLTREHCIERVASRRPGMEMGLTAPCWAFRWVRD